MLGNGPTAPLFYFSASGDDNDDGLAGVVWFDRGGLVCCCCCCSGCVLCVDAAVLSQRSKRTHRRAVECAAREH